VATSTVSIPRAAIDSLMPQLVGRDRQPSAFLVWLWLATRPGTGRRGVAASYADIAEGTGLSRSAAQAAVAHLRKRRLIKVNHASATATPVYQVIKP
jgi:Helix-turn-helix domain